MKHLLILFFTVIIFSFGANAQDYKKHTVEKGETVTKIAKKYKVTPHDIYRLNPDAKNGVNENTVLLIPITVTAAKTGSSPEPEQSTKVANTIHEVQPKETLYSLSKKYNVSVEDIEKANGTALQDGPKIGQKLLIPLKGSPVKAQVKTAEKMDARQDTNVYIYHKVEAGETKYSIARDYDMTLQLIEELNPEVKEVLPLGFNLKLIDKKAVKQAVKLPDFIIYTVQPKETFYSLTRATGLTMEKIIALNPEAQNGLKEGMELKLPASTALNTAVIEKNFADLTQSINRSEQKEVALLLPFNLSRIESDTVRAQMLRTDRFLNITLDFYEGALMAIDSAKTLNLPLKVRILDSKETSKTSDIASIKTALFAADMVIGPFFQNNVETTAALLAERNIPVISPLSKESGSPYSNLFQSVPSSEKLKQGILDYLKSKNGNVIAIIDAKKSSSRQYITNYFPEVKFAPLNPDGTINESALKAMLLKNITNYVILETESTRMVVNATKILTAALTDYTIQLAVTDKTDILEDDEVPLQRLINLKMLYPSVTKKNSSPEAAIFAKTFKEKNGVLPNQYATRGFDVTFDAILRLFQPEMMPEIMYIKASEQVENKFSYIIENGGNFNSGVYILYYDEDLSIKQAQ